MKPGIGRTTLACCAVAAALFTAGSAFAASQTIVAADNTFTQPIYMMDQGEKPPFQNIGFNQHNATATTNGPDAKPLFTSPTIGTGTTTMSGTEYLTTGAYQFICTIHPTTMIATLAVSANGVPVPRPTLALTVIGKDISTAIKRGLRVRIELSANSGGLGLEAMLGKTVIGKLEGIAEAQGTSYVQLKLNKAGKAKLRDRAKASVTVTGTVPFGAPTSTRARLKEK